ncbi:MAG: phytanoyl-CoA dioxygenase family protein [Planctomycetota bacterium]|nr:phytanoyl-CoA dioxygenase family protein [Planctomycetota bacterium]
MKADFKLTQEQIDHFKDRGYLALNKVTTDEDVAFIREIYDRLFRERIGWDEGNCFDLAGADEEGKEIALPQILGPARYAPELNDTGLLKNVTAVAKQLLGEEATCGFAHAIFKPPRIGAETPWHQDAAYWGSTHWNNSISIWVPLQDVNKENGCMEFVPSSHKYDVLTHQCINKDPRIHGLELVEEERYNIVDPVSCPLPAGGATIHGGYMLHHTEPNRSDVPRRAIILSASTPGTERKLPRKFYWNEMKRTPRTDRAKAAQHRKEAASVTKVTN